MQDIISLIEAKYKALHHDPNTFLKGLYHSKPLTYWDYIQLETLMSLQRPKTDYPDEYIFIVYHQISELLLGLISHELKQVVDVESGREASLSDITGKIERINRYAEILDNSFAVMSRGMDYQQYNEFRLSLAPASGFQAVSFRYIELYCTELDNLIRPEMKPNVPNGADVATKLKFVYWQDAGKNHKTGERSLMLKFFEEKYLDSLINEGERLQGKNLFAQLKDKELPEALKQALRKLDYLFNVKWPLSHLMTAETYLMAAGHKTASTGMSDWQKYLHPSYQKRCFFPMVWSDEEKENWGKFVID